MIGKSALIILSEAVHWPITNSLIILSMEDTHQDILKAQAASPTEKEVEELIK